jgi:alkylated DNA repair dioxygenase AlkB
MDNKRIALSDLSSTTKHEVFTGSKDIYKLGAGDSFYFAKFIKDKDFSIFNNILDEVDFVQMFNCSSTAVTPIPRLVAGQCDKESKKTAIYRMPGCNQENIPTKHWTKSVLNATDLASNEMGHIFNHSVVTLYRDKNDSLGYHKDKLLDLHQKTHIISLSFGAARPIVFTSQDKKHSQTLILKPGSLLAIGPKTNKMYFHAIPKLAEDVGPRISLSLRVITTFVNKDDNQISGQGDKYQTKHYPFEKNYIEYGFTDEQKKKMEQISKEELDKIQDYKM